MSMKRNIVIDGQEVAFRASAARCGLMYRSRSATSLCTVDLLTPNA